jgi:chromosome segregation ATPase
MPLAANQLVVIGDTKRRLPARSREVFTLEEKHNDGFAIFDLIERVEDTVDADGRHWPKLPSAPRNWAKELEATIARQKNELSTRCLQIADLCNVKQQQAEALMVARDVIESLDNSVTSLQESLTQRENEAAAVKQKLLHSGEENSALRDQLVTTKKEFAELLQKDLELNTAFNDREIAIVTAREKLTSLEAELSAKTEENAWLAAMIEEIGKRHNESNKSYTQLEHHIEALNTSLAAGNEQIIKLNEIVAKLCARCIELVQCNRNLESEKKETFETLVSQTNRIKSLETALRAEREVAEKKITQLSHCDKSERSRSTITFSQLSGA